MILVDDAGKAFPSINHSPWFGVTLADFVMPFFLFVVGVSVSLVFKVHLLTDKISPPIHAPTSLKCCMRYDCYSWMLLISLIFISYCSF